MDLDTLHTSFFNLDAGIVVFFLALTLAVGLGHGKSVKNIKDYALGGRNFSTTALVATIVATFASGSGFMVTLSRTYSDGLEHLLGALGNRYCAYNYSLIFSTKNGRVSG